VTRPATVEDFRLHRWSLAALVFGVLVPGPAAAGQSAGSQDAGPCPGDGGVTVVVDATAIGGELVVSCAPGSPESGFDALVGAGFSIEAVTTTPGMLCRIDGLPAPGDETCVDDPPADFYWAYWSVESGRWEYAIEGAATSEPEPGSVEGWSFVDGAGTAPPPGVDPSALGVVAAAPAAAEPPPGFPWATAVGVGVVAVFALAGFRHARRRGGEIDAGP
jgi:hypothetical protein